ncbi:MAG: response regulator [Candidatus Sedimenticola sp. (ex Thyasira tokunagai)]
MCVSDESSEQSLRLLPSLRGAPLLLVEGDEINRAVSRETLESIGLRITIADNGIAAVEAVKSEGIVIVLMDLHMPVMDGPEATRRIRQLEGFSEIPIIAMTAASYAEDFDRCIAAGADECITKPLQRQSLVDVLNRRIPPGDYQPLHMLSASQAGKGGSSCLPTDADAEGIIDLRRGLHQLAGNRQLYATLLQRLDMRHGDSSARVAKLVATSQFADASDLLHTIKGVSGNLGASLLYRAAVAFEAELKGERKADDLIRLQAEYDEAVEATGTLIRNGVVPEADGVVDADSSTVTMEEITHRVSQLRKMAVNCEYISNEAVAAIVEPCRSLIESELLDQLRQSAADIDYDSLIDLMDQIAVELDRINTD